MTEHKHPVIAAFRELDTLPALSESRSRALQALSGGSSPAAAMAVVEGDIGLLAAILRAANAADGNAIATVRQAFELLGLERVERITRQVPVADFFEPFKGCDLTPEALRRHSLATQRTAVRLATAVGAGDADELSVAALLHDIGKLPLCVVFGDYPDAFYGRSRTPAGRVRVERERIGTDHAALGGLLLRHWGLPDRTAAMVARHHDPPPGSEAALLQLADAIVHHSHDGAVEPKRVLQAAERARVDTAWLRTLLAGGPADDEPRLRERSPLSPREVVALRGLAEGKTYKQLGAELDLSPSTLRSQLHSSCRKLGVKDRAQAVIVAAERGWI
jgi:putative nucleotidyltransferase with HDIG domain